MFYIGKGVVSHQGKDYAYGAKLPATINSATLEALTKNKLISETKPTGGPAQAADSAALQARTIALTAANTNAQARIEQLEGVIQRRDQEEHDDSVKIGELEAQIEVLTAKLAPADLKTEAAPAAPGAADTAGPKK